MTERPGKPKFDVKRLWLAALAAVTCALVDCQSARADLVPCTVYICFRENPLRVTSGSVSASTTDGEAVVQNSQDVEWSLTYQSSNLVPFRPLKVSSEFSLPGANYETATSTATLDVSSNGNPSVDVDASSSNSNPYGLALGGATAEGVIDYQVSLVSNDPDDAPNGTLEKVRISGVIFGQGLTGPASSGSWSSGSANIAITDSSDNLLFGISSQGAFGLNPYKSSFMMAVGSVYDVEIYASVFTQGNISNASVFADPLFTIDPSSPDANDLYFLYSNGIAQDFGPSGAVPEPSTWAMLLLGFVGLGFASYGRAMGGKRAL